MESELEISRPSVMTTSSVAERTKKDRIVDASLRRVFGLTSVLVVLLLLVVVILVVDVVVANRSCGCRWWW